MIISVFDAWLCHFIFVRLLLFAAMIIIVIVMSLICIQFCESRPHVTFVAFYRSWSVSRDVGVVPLLNDISPIL